MSIELDALDVVTLYGMFGGATAGFVNWTVRGGHYLSVRENAKYYALFSAMGCLSAALASAALSQSPTVGFAAGFIGSFLFLGAGNYL